MLGGALDPLSGVGPDQLRIRELLNRIGERVDGVDVAEVIIATDPNTEGEATATYLVRMLRDIPGLTVTRIASGLPMGGDLEFADELTLGRRSVRPPRDGLIFAPKPLLRPNPQMGEELRVDRAFSSFSAAGSGACQTL